MASGFPGVSAYAYCYNNPMNFNDEWGFTVFNNSEGTTKVTGYSRTKDNTTISLEVLDDKGIRIESGWQAFKL